MARLPGLIFGTLAGMVAGMLLAGVLFVAIEQKGHLSFSKEPLLLIPLFGCLGGGILGGVVGVRASSAGKGTAVTPVTDPGKRRSQVAQRAGGSIWLIAALGCILAGFIREDRLTEYLSFSIFGGALAGFIVMVLVQLSLKIIGWPKSKSDVPAEGELRGDV